VDNYSGDHPIRCLTGQLKRKEHQGLNPGTIHDWFHSWGLSAQVGVRLRSLPVKNACPACASCSIVLGKNGNEKL